jgi:transposase
VEDEGAIRKRFALLKGSLNERSLRLFAAVEAKMLGHGGITTVAKVTGVARSTIWRGIDEIDSGSRLDPERIRRPGGGRKRTTVLDQTLTVDLERLVEPVTRGDPESPLRWTCKSLRKLAAELKALGHRVSHETVGVLLHEMGYSLQSNRKTKEGSSHPDRNAQFEHINRKVAAQISKGGPAISVDTKKKELVGDFKNAGREWRPEGTPEKVRVHDFLDPKLGKAIPYGVYDIARNVGWVSVGVDHDTAAFAVATILRWWRQLGKKAYPKARSILITADSGGSNGSRLRIWKWELQRLANLTGLAITVHHLPPGTSKWNKIEHRLFSFITQNWRGQPLISHAAIVSLISNTRTTAGLKVHCQLDKRQYPTSLEISDEQLATVNIQRDPFHGDWNYTVRPNSRRA